MFGISGLPKIPGQGSPRLSQEMRPSTVYPISLQLIPNLSRRAFSRVSNGARTRSGSRSVPSAISNRRKKRLRRCCRHFNDVSLPKRECQNVIPYINVASFSVFYTKVTVSIGLKQVNSMIASIP